MVDESLKGKKVLVAEDDPSSREMMNDILLGMGLEVVLASDGNEAVEKFKQGSFDLVLMDIRMPNKDGMQASHEMRTLEKEGKKVLIFALTASVLEDERQMIISNGFDDFITKPIDITELREKIKQAIAGGK